MNNLMADIPADLLNQGVSVIPGDTVLLRANDPNWRTPGILPNCDNPSEFHSIWCQDPDDGHITPCEGKWDFAVITGNDDWSPISHLTLADGPNGDVWVEIAWKDVYRYGYYKTGILGEGLKADLTRAIGHVLVTVAENRAHHQI